MKRLTLLIIAAASGCGDSLPELSKYTAVSSDASLFEVRERRPFWYQAMVDASVTSQDGGAAIPTASGALWTFGDTFLEDGGLTNSALVVDATGQQPSGEYLVDSDGTARHLLPLAGAESWDINRVWPGGGIVIGELIYLYFERVNTEIDEIGTPVAFGLARAADDMRFERVTDQIPFKIHSVVRENDQLYTYGVSKVGVWDSYVALGRVAVHDIEDPRAYELIDELFVEGVYGQVDVMWSSYLGSYLMSHAGHPFDNPRAIVFRTAAQPTGPFVNTVEVAHVPGELGDEWNGLLYVPYLHPELNRDNTVAMTFCLHGEDVPHWVEITLLGGWP